MGEYAELQIEREIKAFGGCGLSTPRTRSLKQRIADIAEREGNKDYSKAMHIMTNSESFEDWLNTEYAIPKNKRSLNNKIRYCIFHIKEFKQLLGESK